MRFISRSVLPLWVVICASASAGAVGEGSAPERKAVADVIALADGGRVGSAVSLRVPAEGMALELFFSSDRDKMTDRLESLGAAEIALKSAARNAGLEVRAAGAPQIEAGYGKVGSSMGYIFGEGGAAAGNYLLLARIGESTESLYVVAARLHGVASSLRLSKDISLRLGRATSRAVRRRGAARCFACPDRSASPPGVESAFRRHGRAGTASGLARRSAAGFASGRARVGPVAPPEG